MKSMMQKTAPARWLLIVLAILFTTGCIKEKPSPVEAAPCVLPSGNLVEEAFDTAYETLSRKNCCYRFDEVMQALLSVCEGAPEKKNKERFSDLLVWAKDRGIISTVQAKELYTTYFSSKFISLPDDYQTCSYADRYDRIMAQCRDELEKKEQGLVKVCNDRPGFAVASSQFRQIDLILEAACTACRNE